MDQISGYIHSITFFAQDSGFTVAKLKEEKKKDFTTIVGIMPSIQPGETILCEGEWKIHPSHGKQFNVSSYSSVSPSDEIGIQKYLESGLVKGLGPVFAKKIVDVFGSDTLNVIDNTPEKLLEIPGIGEKKLESIKECWNSQKSIRQLIIFLKTHSLSPSLAQKIFKIYGNQSIEVLKKNPFQLAKEVFGIGFKSADLIATKLGIEKTSQLRLESGIEYILWELSNFGHTCYPKATLLTLATKMLEVEEAFVQTALKSLLLKKELFSEEIELQEKKELFIWLKPFYFYEKEIANECLRLINHPSFCTFQRLKPLNPEEEIPWAEKILHISLEKDQKTAIEEALKQKIHIITGGPGTGKSTITKALLSISEKLTNQIVLAAPTGRAAKRLSEITQKKAFTLHVLLEYDFVSKTFKKNRDNPLKGQLFIIDEASMIDTSLMYYFLRAVPNTAKILFVGDIDQLPSVGPGFVLKDLISSKFASLTRLNKIFRQAAGSNIILNAHKINQGNFPYLSETSKDFIFFELNEPEQIIQKILTLVQKELPQKTGFDPFDDIQVLSPMKKGSLGIENLNIVLQNLLNPSNQPFFRGGCRYHINDKVMQIKNNYDKHVYNGDLGRILHVDSIEQIMTINFEGKKVAYDFSELDEISLAYAVSVHKYQGSECPCIVMPIHTCHFKLLYRNLLYTAITRGKKLVVLIGKKQAIAMAVKNNEVLKRYTGLKAAIQQAFSSKEPIPSQQILLPGMSV